MENYSEVNVRVVNLFVSMCQIHQEQKTINKPRKVGYQATPIIGISVSN